MAEEQNLNWLELCKAASETKSTEELLNIVRELNDILEREEQMHRGMGKPVEANKSIEESRC
jgi:hypothetical protein